MIRRLLLPFALLLCLSSAAIAAEPPAAGAAAVEKLVVIDRKVGTGVEARPGMALRMHYTGWLYDAVAGDRHGRQFDSSRGGEPLSFRMGDPRMIKGWTRGIEGMRVGGRRELWIPAALGYGSRGAGDGVIPPGAALVFDLELLDAREP